MLSRKVWQRQRRRRRFVPFTLFVGFFRQRSLLGINQRNDLPVARAWGMEINHTARKNKREMRIEEFSKFFIYLQPVTTPRNMLCIAGPYHLRSEEREKMWPYFPRHLSRSLLHRCEST